MGKVFSLGRRSILLSCIALVLMPGAVAAHVSARADLPRHGGEVLATGELFVELVVTEKQLTLHARDDRARVIDLSDAQANALVWGDNGSRSVPFAARSATALTAAADLPTTGKFRIVVSLELPGQEKTSLLFGPMRL